MAMRETNPLSSCSEIKVELISTEDEDVALEHVIKLEEVDLKPDCIECETDDIENTDNDEQMENHVSLLVDSPDDNTIHVTDDRQSSTSLSNNMDTENRSRLTSNMDVHTKNNITAKHANDNCQIYRDTEIGKNDDLQPLRGNGIPNDMKKEIKVEEIDESEMDILDVADPRLTENSNVTTETKTENKEISSIVKLETKNEVKQGTHMYSCNECTTYNSGKRCLLISPISTHSCHFCGYRCARKSTLKKHLRTHTGEKPLSCEFCKYRCSQKSHLQTHLRTHTGEKPFSCEFCEFRSANKSHLKIHLRKHTGEKPFSCEFCDYRCLMRSNLTKHLRAHTGEKPFSCKFCLYRCISKSNLKLHLRTHTGEKPFSCQFCHYRCGQRSSLTRHLKRHAV